MTGAAGIALPPGFRVIARASVGSTNDEAKALARDSAPEGAVVWARRQERGRGRRGRAWASPEGNLYASIVLRPDAPANRAAQLSFVAALAIADFAADVLPDPAVVRCKWPNDVLVHGRKLSGVLLEAEPGEGESVAWVVLGVGVNLLSHPEGMEAAATSLAAEGAPVIAPERALEAYLAALDRWLAAWRAHGFAPIRAAWLARAAGLGGGVTVRLPDRTLDGTFVDLDSDGVLLLDRSDGGGRERIAAGDVFLPVVNAGA